MGLPTPAAGGVIASLIIFHQDMLPQLARQNSLSYQVSEIIIIYSLPFVILGLSLLMISRIRYPHVVNQYIRGRKPFAHLIRVLAFLVLIIWNLQAALVLIFCSFAASGFIKWFYFRVITRKSTGLANRKPSLVITNPPEASGQGNTT
jgi:CDP-diacylglycerol--serine O-phosphatidyltransferase